MHPQPHTQALALAHSPARKQILALVMIGGRDESSSIITQFWRARTMRALASAVVPVHGKGSSRRQRCCCSSWLRRMSPRVRPRVITLTAYDSGAQSRHFDRGDCDSLARQHRTLCATLERVQNISGLQRKVEALFTEPLLRARQVRDVCEEHRCLCHMQACVATARRNAVSLDAASPTPT